MKEAWRAGGWRMVEKGSGVVKNTWDSLLEGVREAGRGGGELLDWDYIRVPGFGGGARCD